MLNDTIKIVDMVDATANHTSNMTVTAGAVSVDPTIAEAIAAAHTHGHTITPSSFEQMAYGWKAECSCGKTALAFSGGFIGGSAAILECDSITKKEETMAKKFVPNIPIVDYLRIQMLAPGKMLVVQESDNVVAYGPTAEKYAQLLGSDVEFITAKIPMLKIHNSAYSTLLTSTGVPNGIITRNSPEDTGNTAGNTYHDATDYGNKNVAVTVDSDPLLQECIELTKLAMS